MIKIKRSPTADTRTCDVTKVDKQQLLNASLQHIADVGAGLAFFSAKLVEAASKHDYDKLSAIDQFYSDFQHKFTFGSTSWWDNHRKIHRHHLAHQDGIPDNVNLIDILEYITDCVMAGKARCGEVYALDMTDELLQKAFVNTVCMLSDEVVVQD